MDLDLSNITYSTSNEGYILKDKNDKKILEFGLKKIKEIIYYDELNTKFRNKLKTYAYIKINDTVYDINKPVKEELLNERLKNGLTTYTSITKNKNGYTYREFDVNGDVITKYIQTNNKTIYEESRIDKDTTCEKVYVYKNLFKKLDKRLISSRKFNKKEQ